MKFIILPIEDLKTFFSDEEISHMRKSTDETKAIVHEEILIRKRNALGLVTLPSEDTGQIEWTYPAYEYNSEELNNLLNSKEWNDEVLEDSTTDQSETYSTSKKVEKSYWNF